jgi:hypothetical protein
MGQLVAKPVIHSAAKLAHDCAPFSKETSVDARQTEMFSAPASQLASSLGLSHRRNSQQLANASSLIGSHRSQDYSEAMRPNADVVH